MALRNLAAVFCQTYSIGKTMAQTEPGDFEKKHRRMLH